MHASVYLACDEAALDSPVIDVAGGRVGVAFEAGRAVALAALRPLSIAQLSWPNGLRAACASASSSTAYA